MNIGLWIDHTKAVIVSFTGKKEQLVTVESSINRHFRSPAGKNDSNPNGRRNVTAGDIQDREFNEHLSIFYKKVVSYLLKAGSIYIIGPGESKGEIAKKLLSGSLSRRVVGVEKADKMTDRQIAAKFRKYFQSQKAQPAQKRQRK